MRRGARAAREIEAMLSVALSIRSVHYSTTTRGGHHEPRLGGAAARVPVPGSTSAPLEELLAAALERPLAEQKRPDHLAAEQVADVVAQDGRGGRGRDHQLVRDWPSCERRAAVIRAVSPGSGTPVDSPPTEGREREVAEMTGGCCSARAQAPHGPVRSKTASA
jgi:hypothetical protein